MNIKTIFLFLAVFISFLVPFSEATAACNPNESCTVNGPYVPCPTLSEPLRTCPSSYDDPVCLTRRLACAGTLTACVTANLVGGTAGTACVACLVAAIGGTGGTTAAACAPVCGITAAAGEQVVQKCQ